MDINIFCTATNKIKPVWCSPQCEFKAKRNQQLRSIDEIKNADKPAAVIPAASAHGHDALTRPTLGKTSDLWLHYFITRPISWGGERHPFQIEPAGGELHP